MSWLRTALSKAAEAGAKNNLTNNLTRTVRTYAGTVYQQAAGSAKIVQDRLSGRHFNSFKNAVKRLDEVALNARGHERVQALARWLAALQDIQGSKGDFPSGRGESPTAPHEEESVSPQPASTVYFSDPDMVGGEPLNFRDVFLRSHALENIVTSLILEAPEEEEVSMLLEMFGLCLAGGQELHNAIISSIQDLSKAFSSYLEEVMIKRDDLLQMARDAVTGLKLSSQVERLDVEIGNFQQQIVEKQGVVDTLKNAEGGSAGGVSSCLTELEETLQLGAHLHNCLQRKTELSHAGDTPEGRAEKVEKLKGLTATLNMAVAEMQQQIVEKRQQKQEAMNYRFTKAHEVTESEKALAAEIRVLEKKRRELEAELKEVKTALAAATARHINTQEEKEQFDEASSHLVAHLSAKEEELTHAVAAQKAEASVVGTWLSFLEDTWLLQSNCSQERDEDTKAAYEDSKKLYLQLTESNLLCREEELNFFLKRLKFCGDELEALQHKQENMQELGMEGVIADIVSAKRKIQDKYLEAKEQVDRALKAINKLKDDVQTHHQLGKDGEIDETTNKLNSIFAKVEKLWSDFEARQKPPMEMEQHGWTRLGRSLPSGEAALAPPSASVKPPLVSDVRQYNDPYVVGGVSKSIADSEKEGANAVLEETAGSSTPQETEGWEFDELDEDIPNTSMEIAQLRQVDGATVPKDAEVIS